MNIITKLKITFIIVFLAISSMKAQQWGDYTLYSLMNSTTTTLLDTNGNTAKTWTHASTAKSAYSCYLMPGGILWRSVSKSGNSFQGGPIAGEIQKVDWNGNVLWDYVYSTTEYCTHHDICPLPNGNVLLISYDRKSSTDVANAGCTFGSEVWSDKVVEIMPTGATTGTVVWEWKLWDHLVQNANSAKANYSANIIDHPELLNVNYKTQ
ncbi:MAG: aryl-sulfate sulfotransferase, partial [Bacteroidetes bacterium]|nr:aryl-sulfate sulfotransferase [Bacteroidota bacterium]